MTEMAQYMKPSTNFADWGWPKHREEDEAHHEDEVWKKPGEIREKRSAGRRADSENVALYGTHLRALLRAWASLEKEGLVQRISDAAHESGVDPEETYYAIFVEALRRHEEEKLLQQFNAAYGDEMEQEEKEISQHVKEYHGRRLNAG